MEDKKEVKIYEFDVEACVHKNKRKPHRCLYRSELFDDETLCTCCTKCRDQCADDI